MLITTDTVTALKVRLGAELATLQAAMVASRNWTPAQNNAFGKTAEEILTWVQAPIHYLSLAADYNDGISRRNDLLAWWTKFLLVEPNGPPKPSEIKQSGGDSNPLAGATSLIAAATTLVLVVGGVWLGVRVLGR